MGADGATAHDGIADAGCSMAMVGSTNTWPSDKSCWYRADGGIACMSSRDFWTRFSTNSIVASCCCCCNSTDGRAATLSWRILTSLTESSTSRNCWDLGWVKKLMQKYLLSTTQKRHVVSWCIRKVNKHGVYHNSQWHHGVARHEKVQNPVHDVQVVELTSKPTQDPIHGRIGIVHGEERLDQDGRIALSHCRQEQGFETEP